MSTTEYTKVYSGNFIITQMIKNKLETQGINPLIKDESESGRLAGFGASIQDYREIFVHNDELEKATTIVNLVKAEM
ncbi:MAG: putative signal transducing protein [Winogradskyella sp.]